MSEDILMWSEEIVDALDFIEDSLDSLSTMKEKNKPDKLTECDAKFKELTSLFRSYNIELRTLSGPSLKEYKQKKTEYTSRMTEYKTKLKFHRSGDERSALLAGHTKVSKDTTKMSGDELIGESLKTQDATKDALKRIMVAGSDAKEIGLAAGAELTNQTNQLENITSQLNKIDDDLTRSNKLIRAFGIRMMTDRCIRIFLFLLTVGFAAIIVLSVIMPETADEAGFNVPDELKPPSQQEIVNDAKSAKNAVTNRLLRGAAGFF